MTNKKIRLRHVNLSQKQDKRSKINKKEITRALAGTAVLLSACSKKAADCGNYPKEFCDPNKEMPRIVDNEDGTQTVVGVKNTGMFNGEIQIGYGDVAAVIVLLTVAALANKNIWKYLKKEKKPKNNREGDSQSDF